MSDAPLIDIAEMVLPVSGQYAAEQVTQALHAEASRLYFADQASGLDWSADLHDVALDFENGSDPEEMGRAIAVQLRNRLVRADRVREMLE